MANPNKPVFLGKGGKLHGPFEPEEIEEMRASGELSSYSYLWDDEAQAWRPLELPPPKPNVEKPPSEEAICHNFDALLAGSVENITDTGCDFLSRDPADSPKFGLNCRLVLNIIDGSKTKAMNVEAVLSHILHRDGVWIYRMKWPR